MRLVRVLQKETWRGDQSSHTHIVIIAKKKKKVRKYMFLTFDNTFSDGKCCIFTCFFINKYHRRIKTHPHKFYHLPSNIFINFPSPTAALTSQDGGEGKITSLALFSSGRAHILTVWSSENSWFRFWSDTR